MSELRFTESQLRKAWDDSLYDCMVDLVAKAHESYAFRALLESLEKIVEEERRKKKNALHKARDV